MNIDPDTDIAIPAVLDQTKTLAAMLDRAGRRGEFHPLATIFPLMEGEEYTALVADIKAHGLREPIVTYTGKILDGRNRYRACLDADVEPRFTEYEGDDPLAFVVSLNLKRRHLSESQRAMVAAKLSGFKVGDNQHSEGLPIGRASEMLNVGQRSVARAREVIDEGAPELQHAVESGVVSVSAAADIATLPKDEQTVVVARGEKEILDKAKEIRAAKVQKKRAKVRRAVIRTVKPEVQAPRPSRGKDAVRQRVREAISALSGLPSPHEVMGYFAGTDEAVLVSERLPDAATWLAGFSGLWPADEPATSAASVALHQPVDDPFELAAQMITELDRILSRMPNDDRQALMRRVAGMLDGAGRMVGFGASFVSSPALHLTVKGGGPQ